MGSGVLYAILIPPDTTLQEVIAKGERTCVILAGQHEYLPNTHVVLCCPKNRWMVLARITTSVHQFIHNVEEEEWRAGGFENRRAFEDAIYKELLGNRLGIYQNALVTIIHWELEKG